MAQQSWSQGTSWCPQPQRAQYPGMMGTLPQWNFVTNRAFSMTFPPPGSPPYNSNDQQQQQQQMLQQQQLRPQFLLQQQPGQMSPWGMMSYPQNYNPQVGCGSMLCGVPGQPGPCDCCGNGPTDCCTCCTNGPIEVYCCGPPGTPGCMDCLTSVCDWTYLFMIMFTVLSVLGFFLVLVLGYQDDLFRKFDVKNTEELQKSIQGFIVKPPCTPESIIGASGTICMGENLNAHALVVQLSSWTLQRNTLYFIAMIFSIFTLIYASIVDYQRRKNEALAESNISVMKQQLQLQHQQLDKQSVKREGSEGTQGSALQQKPQQQELENKPQLQPQPQPQLQQQQQHEQQERKKQDQLLPLQNPQQFLFPRGAIRVYGTPFYDVMRIAWFVMGMVVFFWVCNLFFFFCSFMSLYRKSTNGELREFFDDFFIRFCVTVMCVTVYLAWPLVNIFVEMVLWIVFILPWLLFRAMCKPGIENLRPALPLHQIPGCIRLDMFFTEFNDIKRIGLSESAWKLMTGDTTPLFSCCENEVADRDPLMTMWHQCRYEWYLRMQGIYPVNGMGMPPPAPAPAPAPVSLITATDDMHEGGLKPQSRSSRRRNGHGSGTQGVELADVPGSLTGATTLTLGSNSPRRVSGQMADNMESPTRGRRHHERSTHRHRSHEHRSRSARHRGDEDGGETNGGAGEGRSRRHRHSSSHHRNHHRRRESNQDSTLTTTNNVVPAGQQSNIVMDDMEEL